MGKFQSKHAAAASKRRESPEGDSFVVSAYASGRKGAEEAERRAGGGVEHRARDKQELPNGDPKEGPFREDQGPLEVMLPPEKAEGREGPGQLFSVDDGERATGREGPRGPGKKSLNIDALQCDVSVEEDNRQEWTFTLYDFDNSGKVTREDMSSLMHTIYEVVDASVNHASGSSKTLRVKLTVSPEPPSKRKEWSPAGQDREPTRGRTESEFTEDPRMADRRLSAHCSPALYGGPTVWTRTQSAETTTWTSLGSRTTRLSLVPGHRQHRPDRSTTAGPHTSQAGLAPKSLMLMPCTTADPRCWQSTWFQLQSLLPGPWLHSPGSRGQRSSSSGLPRVWGSHLGCQAAASLEKPLATACQLPLHPRPLRMATTSHSPLRSPRHSPTATNDTGRRPGRVTRHSRLCTASPPWWSMKWCGTCRPCWGPRATRCL
ncbi:protein naked cuticle homolog 2 isoform X3 [Castor canadensis]|uniref:Protein naked cuticle homolog 2 isoform X3 n=1 Tax=Castor canadensis TaxID=51338 RepID=A0AC58MWV1_CASCN